MAAPPDVLRGSVDRLRALVEPLTPAQLEAPSYASDWTIAQVLSHIGSGAVIATRAVDDALADVETPADFNQGVWDEWNAKPPTDQVADALAADATLIARLDAVSDSERRRFRRVFGPFDLDFDGFVDLRVNEHALHTWDVEVALDLGATIPSVAAGRVVDHMEYVVRFTARAQPELGTVVIGTTDPDRVLALTIATDGSSLTSATPGAVPDVQMPTEAFVRLVYGRLDVAHTPATAVGDLDALRGAFPGL